MDQKDIVIAPSSFTLTVAPGENAQIPVTITNNSDTDIVFTVSSARLPIAAAKEKKLDLQQYEDEETSWIASTPSFSIQKGETKTLQATLSIPTGLSDISEYPVLLLRQSNEGSGQVALATDVAIPVFLNLRNAQDNAKTEITQFNAAKSIVFSPENIFTVQVKNSSEGEVFTQPKGKIYIYDNNGTRLSSQLDINESFSRLYKDQSFEEVLSWQGKKSYIPVFGKYTAVAEIYTGGTFATQKVTAVQTFWIIPVYHIVGLIVVIAVLAGIVFSAWKSVYKSAAIKNRSESV
ncbi:MAG: hypothetical protein QY314_01775 [Candidatus Dojkabacteria bacterium]|nr:MAG: hypothetical protein QY314_01775 [Candidatus Dojkabacteria bacterium]